ncbi:MAG: hypothetical protein FWC82_00665 [Firmicutes bacterium]|nr:hypothetical protein [Bacillota bacterium]
MSIAKMQKLKIVGLHEDKKAIVELLRKSGNFEISEAVKDIEKSPKDSTEINSIKKNQETVLSAIEYLSILNAKALVLNKRLVKEAKKIGEPIEKPFEVEKMPSNVKFTASHETYEKARKDTEKTMIIASALQEIRTTRAALKEKIKELRELNQSLAPYQNMPYPFSVFKDTKTVAVMLVQGEIITAEEFENLEKDCLIESFETKQGLLWGVVCKIEHKVLIVKKLAELGFSICTYSFDKAPKDFIESNKVEIKNLHNALSEKMREGLLLQAQLPNLKILYDILGFDLERFAIEEKILKTQHSIIIEGWVPLCVAAVLKEDLEKNIDKIVVEAVEADEEDAPPTLLVNRGLVKNFEGITKGYSAPRYRVLDPSPVMSLFFFVFFGIMLADAGYGLMMAVLGLLLGLVFKVDTPAKRMGLMLGVSGFSGIIFGILFGGVFAIEAIPPLWFDPMQEPIMMIAFSIIIGAVHLLTGFTLKTIATIRLRMMENKEKKNLALAIVDGLLDSVFMYTLLIGIGMLALWLALDSNFPFSTIALVLLIISLAGIVLTRGRNRKGIGGKISGGFGGLYGLIGLFSDLLSYTRLFGLALASAAVGMAFNEIGMLLFGFFPPLGFVVGGLILAALHAFNFALSALSAYVHNIRLQYVEFFGKFYEGDGRLFSPLGEETKFVSFLNTTNTNKNKRVRKTQEVTNL